MHVNMTTVPRTFGGCFNYRLHESLSLFRCVKKILDYNYLLSIIVIVTNTGDYPVITYSRTVCIYRVVVPLSRPLKNNKNNDFLFVVCPFTTKVQPLLTKHPTLRLSFVRLLNGTYSVLHRTSAFYSSG